MPKKNHENWENLKTKYLEISKKRYQEKSSLKTKKHIKYKILSIVIVFVMFMTSTIAIIAGRNVTFEVVIEKLKKVFRIKIENNTDIK